MALAITFFCTLGILLPNFIHVLYGALALVILYHMLQVKV